MERPTAPELGAAASNIPVKNSQQSLGIPKNFILHYLIEINDIGAAKRLLQENAELVLQTDEAHGRTALHVACSRGVPLEAILQNINTEGSDVDATPSASPGSAAPAVQGGHRHV